MTTDIPTIYVGYDPREDEPYEVLKYTAQKHASGPINIYPIKQDLLRRIGLYRRVWQLGSSALPSPVDPKNDIQHRDQSDGRPFATDFSFSRFLTPFLHRLEGWAEFMCLFLNALVCGCMHASPCVCEIGRASCRERV